MHAGHYALEILIDLLEYRQADPRHDPHTDDNIRRVGELHADLGHGRTHGAHAVRQHIHGAAAHCAAEEALQLAAHVERVFPVVGGAGRILRERTDEGAVFDARDIVRIGTRVKAPRPEVLIHLQESAAGDHLGAEPVVLFLRPIHPVDRRRLGEFSAIFSTHFCRCSLLLSGSAVSRVL